jgi:hypothetical protein
MKDRLLALLVGAICGAIMAAIYAFIDFALLHRGTYCITHPGTSWGTISCYIWTSIFWPLLLAPPLIGLLFGTDKLLNFLSIIWGAKNKKPPM